MPSRIKYLSVTFLEDVMIGAMLFATGSVVSLSEELARGLGRTVQINGPGSAASAVTPGGGSGSNFAVARSSAQLAGTPSSDDIALGASAQFYDPAQTVDATHPWVYYSATSTAYVAVATGNGSVTFDPSIPAAPGAGSAGSGTAVAHANHQHPLPTAGQMNVFSIGTNLTAAQIQSELADGTAPTGNNSYINTTAGTTAMTGFANFTSLNFNDEVVYNGLTNQWFVVPYVDNGLRVATMPFSKADGTFRAAVSNIDYGAAPSWQRTLPIVLPGAWASAPVNGLVTFTTPITANTQSGWYADGCLIYFAANVLNGSNGAGLYYSTFSSTTVAQVTTTMYTPGTPFSIPTSPTNITGTGSASATPTATDILVDQVTATNPMGKTGQWVTEFYQRNTNSANTKNLKTKINTSSVGYNASSTTQIYSGAKCTVSNKGKTNVQGAPANDAVFGANTGSSSAVETNASCTYSLYANLQASATDWMVIETCSMTFKFGN